MSGLVLLLLGNLRSAKQICKTAGPSLAASLEPLPQHRNVANLSNFYRYYIGRYSSELPQLALLSYSPGSLTHYSDRCMIFLSPFLVVIRITVCTPPLPAEGWGVSTS